MNNLQVAQLLDTYGALLEMSGDDGWRSTTAYRAAETIRNLQIPVDKADLTSLKGIGENTANKIQEALQTGTFSALERLKLEYPVSVLELTKIHGIGIKKAMKIWKAHGIKSLAEMKQALDSGRVQDEDLKRRVEFALRPMDRLPRAWVEGALQPVLECLRNAGYKFEVAGSIRRKRDTVRDADILVLDEGKIVAEDLSKLLTQMASEKGIAFEIGPSGEHKARAFLWLNPEIQLQIDLLLIPLASWGSALNYFTGSAEHNIALRKLALAKGWKINEYGIYDEHEQKIGGERETDIYMLLGLKYVPPELREGQEIEEVPEQWIEQRTIKYDLHVHSNWSDGRCTIEELVRGAQLRELKGICVCDHSYRIRDKVDEYLKDIERVATLTDYWVLKGIEIDISLEGNLDLDDSELHKFDLVIAAIHRQHDQNIEARLLAAASHPYVSAIAHPTGRQFGHREIPDINWDTVFEACRKNKVALEINASPDRIDLPEHLIRRAMNCGCSFIITSDAHSEDGVGNFEYGIDAARRAKLTKDHVYYANQSLKNLKKNP